MKYVVGTFNIIVLHILCISLKSVFVPNILKSRILPYLPPPICRWPLTRLRIKKGPQSLAAPLPMIASGAPDYIWLHVLTHYPSSITPTHVLPENCQLNEQISSTKTFHTHSVALWCHQPDFEEIFVEHLQHRGFTPLIFFFGASFCRRF